MFDPRKRWDLMSSSFNPSITRDASGEIPRIHPGAWARSIHHGQMMGPNYGTSGNAAINAAMARQASQTPQYDYTMDASAGSPAKKKSNKLKYIVEALKEMEGPEPPKLSGGKFGRAMPAPLGFSLANMGAYVGDPVARQAAMAKARMEEELQRRRKLLGGGY